MKLISRFNYIFSDLKASLAVFFVAISLCLGIAHASGAPLISGLMGGIIGGLLIGLVSKSHLSVSGPAAGLITICLDAIHHLGRFEAFLLSIIIAGVVQFLFGIFRLGNIVKLVPHAVIHGMLAAIGLILMIKQLPHLFGCDFEILGDESLHLNNFLTHCFDIVSIPVAIIGTISLALLIYLDYFTGINKIIPSVIFVVILGLIFNFAFMVIGGSWLIEAEHLVNLSKIDNFMNVLNHLPRPDFSLINNLLVWKYALIIAVVASIESLLCVSAIDDLDPKQNITPPNSELIAQGIGNFCAGFLGSLPVTSVIVRSSVNLNAGATSKLSCVLHGLWILLAALFMTNLINMIPLASLAAILLLTGYKLCKPQFFVNAYKEGKGHFFSFLLTILGIVFTDLLIGIALGLFVYYASDFLANRDKSPS